MKNAAPTQPITDRDHARRRRPIGRRPNGHGVAASARRFLAALHRDRDQILRFTVIGLIVLLAMLAVVTDSLKIQVQIGPDAIVSEAETPLTFDPMLGDVVSPASAGDAPRDLDTTRTGPVFTGAVTGAGRAVVAQAQHRESGDATPAPREVQR